MKSITRLGILVSVAAIPLISFAQNTGGIRAISGTIIDLIDQVLVPLLLAIAFLIFIYGVAKTYIFSNGDEGAVEKGHSLILWGLVGFFVIVSVWGLVNIVVDTFGLNHYGPPDIPKVGSLRA